MAVTSYLDPIYRDVRFVGASIGNGLLGQVTSRAFIQALSQGSFVSVTRAMLACIIVRCSVFS